MSQTRKIVTPINTEPKELNERETEAVRGGLRGDANGNSSVDSGDYGIWRSRFGSSI